MNIRTQHHLSAWISLAVVVLIGVTLFDAGKRLDRAINISAFETAIATGTSELRFVTFEFILHQNERPRLQWQQRHASVATLLASSAFEGSALQPIVIELRESNLELAGSFAQLTQHYAAPGNASRDPAAAALAREAEARLVGRILTTSQRMLSTTHRMQRESDLDIAEAKRRENVLTILGGALIALIVIANLLLLTRNTLLPIRRLQRGVEIIGDGDLNFRTGITSDNEIGALSRAFDSMTTRLQESRTALEAEHLRAARREAAAESEARYQQLVHALPTAVYTCDAEGRIVLYNEAAVALWGREPDIDQDRWCGSWRIFDPDDGRPLALDQRPMAVAIREGRPIRGREIVVERSDGTRFDVLPHPQPLFDTAGAVIGAVNMLVDITERKRAEAERKRLLDVLEASLNEIYIFAADTLRYWYVNRGALNNLGYSADAMNAMTPLDLKPEFDTASFRELIAPLVRGERDVIVFQSTHRRADATVYPVEVHLQLVGVETQRAFLAVTFDIAERERTAHALHDRTAQLRLLTRRLLEAEETERRQLARELHDRIGQNITALGLGLNMLHGELSDDSR